MFSPSRSLSHHGADSTLRMGKLPTTRHWLTVKTQWAIYENVSENHENLMWNCAKISDKWVRHLREIGDQSDCGCHVPFRWVPSSPWAGNGWNSTPVLYSKVPVPLFWGWFCEDLPNIFKHLEKLKLIGCFHMFSWYFTDLMKWNEDKEDMIRLSWDIFPNFVPLLYYP